MATSKQTDIEESVHISIASAPRDIGSVPSLLADIASLGNHSDLSADREARLSLLDKARSLVAALETPRETAVKHVGAETASFFSIGLGVEVGLFHELAKNNGSPKKDTELAEILGFDLGILRQILRHLAAMKHIDQTGPDEYTPNNFTLCLTYPPIADGYPLYRDMCITPMQHLHQYLAIKSYSAPTSITDNPFTFGHHTSSSMFDYLTHHPLQNTRFNSHMSGYRVGRPSWLHPSIYPVQSRLVTGHEPPSALLVDIGGNTGRDLLQFAHTFSPPKGTTLILQDQPPVLESAPHSELEAAGITPMPHDFFTPQPVHGARAYFLHHILHDWPDERCVEIVTQIKGAMRPGYSRLLVNEHVIPSMGASWEATYLDLYMMLLFGAKERTEEDWVALLEDKCGLRVVKVWNPGNGIEGVIECEVPVEG
ncbi:O-methyltransferase [Podospora aff. communis PSN243]|uniref:O-methyltransferase n=1 Tax=Podospora aff. communis PSN243 TaxID=3040156 RepID=A0AAV9GPK1_9PEZI|nr:O-methyltransferase [Podospora aff. communis PSN243]